MKALLAVLFIVASFLVYQGRQRISALQSELESAQQQLDRANNELKTTKEQMAREGVAVSAPPVPGVPPVPKKSGTWMWDPSHKSPLDRGGKP